MKAWMRIFAGSIENTARRWMNVRGDVRDKGRRCLVPFCVAVGLHYSVMSY